MSRPYVNAERKRQLRREVNFGCPVHGCGIPYLTYNHFDPPVAEGGTDDPDGMIALCANHHHLADGEVYTKDQLRELKRKPYLGRPEVRDRLEWMRREIVFRFGSVTHLRPSVILATHNRRMIWVERDTDHNLLLNMDLPGGNGQSVIQMENNDWLITGDLADLEVPPGGRSMTVRAPEHDLTLKLVFKDLEEMDFRKEVETDTRKSWERSQVRTEALLQARPELRDALDQSSWTLEETVSKAWQELGGIVEHWPALEVTIGGHLPWPKPIDLRPGLTTLGGSIGLGNVIVISNGGTAIHIG